LKLTPSSCAGAAQGSKTTALGVLSLLLITAATPARADVYCQGSALEHLVYNDGTLMIRSTWRNDWTYLCSMQVPWKGVSTEACFSWFGLLTAARTHNKPIGIYYSGDTACSALATYVGAPAPVYVRMAE
jgi:hypothetical protein